MNTIERGKRAIKILKETAEYCYTFKKQGLVLTFRQGGMYRVMAVWNNQIIWTQRCHSHDDAYLVGHRHLQDEFTRIKLEAVAA